MEIRILKEKILDALQQVYAAVGHRNSIGILSNIKIDVSETQLILIASDLEIEIKSTVSISSSEFVKAGSTAIPARKFLDILKSLPEKSTAIIRTSENRCLIATSKRLKFKMNVLPSDDFPIFNDNKFELEDAINVQIKEGDFKRALDKTLYATAITDVRYFLTGVYFNYKDNLVQLVASNGHMLALYEILATPKKESKIETVIPKKAAVELQRRLTNSDLNISLYFINGLMVVESSVNSAHSDSTMHITMTCKLIEDKYPDFKKVIPKNNTKIAVINKDMFRDRLLRASILTNENLKNIDLIFDEKSLVITARNQANEEATEVLDIVFNSNEPLQISFLCNYLTDTIAAIETDEIEMHLNNKKTACLITSKANANHVSIIMPLVSN